MGRLDEANMKAQAEKAYYAQAQCGQAVAGAPRTADYGDCCQEARPSLRAEAEGRVRHHSAEAQKQERAAMFFREHPEFDEFIQLIRSGVIGI